MAKDVEYVPNTDEDTCPNCGQEVNGNTYCPNCGAILNVTTDESDEGFEDDEDLDYL